MNEESLIWWRQIISEVQWFFIKLYAAEYENIYLYNIRTYYKLKGFFPYCGKILRNFNAKIGRIWKPYGYGISKRSASNGFFAIKKQSCFNGFRGAYPKINLVFSST